MAEEKKHTRMGRFGFLQLLVIVQCTGLFAQSLPYGLYNLKDDLAVQGYDVVSYHTQNAPVKGKSEYKAQINGATYLFVCQENLDKFLKNPAAYEPEYGGWCAYAIGLDGSKVKIDPKTYKIIDGKLYLFYNTFPVNTLKKWNRNEAELMQKADEYWSQLVREFKE